MQYEGESVGMGDIPSGQPTSAGVGVGPVSTGGALSGAESVSAPESGEAESPEALSVTRSPGFPSGGQVQARTRKSTAQRSAGSDSAAVMIRVAPRSLLAPLPLLGLLAACTGAKPGDDSAPAGTDSADTDTGPQPAALAELSNGECPDFSSTGSSKFTSAGEERKVISYWPADRPADMPVVFVWHYLGGTARDMVDIFDLEGYADSAGALVIAPDSLDSNAFEWDFWNGGTVDVTMYDDLRTCASQEFGVNLKKVSSTGMSAGALWTSWLAVNRGDTLSTVLTFSGGTEPVVDYKTPPNAFPALLDYGGDTDQFSGGGASVDFQETTINFANELYADGHDVMLCNHNLGHSIPPEGRDQMDAWLTAQTYGQPNTVDVSALSDYCVAYDGSLTTSG